MFNAFNSVNFGNFVPAQTVVSTSTVSAGAFLLVEIFCWLKNDSKRTPRSALLAVRFHIFRDDPGAGLHKLTVLGSLEGVHKIALNVHFAKKLAANEQRDHDL